MVMYLYLLVLYYALIKDDLLQKIGSVKQEMQEAVEGLANDLNQKV